MSETKKTTGVLTLSDGTQIPLDNIELDRVLEANRDKKKSLFNMMSSFKFEREDAITHQSTVKITMTEDVEYTKTFEVFPKSVFGDKLINISTVMEVNARDNFFLTIGVNNEYYEIDRSCGRNLDYLDSGELYNLKQEEIFNLVFKHVQEKLWEFEKEAMINITRQSLATPSGLDAVFFKAGINIYPRPDNHEIYYKAGDVIVIDVDTHPGWDDVVLELFESDWMIAGKLSIQSRILRGSTRVATLIAAADGYIDLREFDYGSVFVKVHNTVRKMQRVN